MIEKVKKSPIRKTVALVAAEDYNSLEAVLHAEKEGITKPILVGDELKIREILQKFNSTEEYEIYNEPDCNRAAHKAVEIIRNGKADFLMKGKIETAGNFKGSGG